MNPGTGTAHDKHVGRYVVVENVVPTSVWTKLSFVEFGGKAKVEYDHDDSGQDEKCEGAQNEFFHGLELKVDELISRASVEKCDGDYDGEIDEEPQGTWFNVFELKRKTLAAVYPFFEKHERDEGEKVEVVDRGRMPRFGEQAGGGDRGNVVPSVADGVCSEYNPAKGSEDKCKKYLPAFFDAGQQMVFCHGVAITSVFAHEYEG